MKTKILAAILLGVVAAVFARATDLGIVDKQRYLDAMANGELKAGIVGQIGGAFLSNPNQSSLKELGLFHSTPGAPTTDFNWTNGVPTTVRITWDEQTFSLDVGQGACVLSMQVVPFDKIYLVINSVNFFNDGALQIGNISLDGQLFQGVMTVNARTFRGTEFKNLPTGPGMHSLSFQVMFSTTSDSPPFDDDLEFQAALVASVPEPGSTMLVVAGSFFLGCRRSRRGNV